MAFLIDHCSCREKNFALLISSSTGARRSPANSPLTTSGYSLLTVTRTVDNHIARLRQTTVSLTGRASWTATPTLTLQLYAEPFVSSGSFSDWRELDDPRANDYEARYRPYSSGEDPGGFNVKQFNSNVVLRWEYRAASTFFLVWQQGRSDGRNPGSFEMARDYRDLFRAHPINTILAKVSYWWNP